MTVSLQWERDGHDWPNRTASRFISAGGIIFHVQIMGEGTPILLVHGTGSSTHTWRDVMPLLAQTHQVIALDLPGHGFTKYASASQLSLAGMAKAISDLLNVMNLIPDRVVGHSAGAAILVEMVQAGYIKPADIISFNGAFFPIAGFIGQFFSPLAKAIASFGVLQKIIVSMADRPAIERLLNDTGSHINDQGIRYYLKLFSDEGHVGGTLSMMAAWELGGMAAMLRRLGTKLYLVKATKDRTVSPETADEVAQLAHNSAIIIMKGLGHLSHEEDPLTAAKIILNPEDFRALSHDQDYASGRAS
ncbi:MAG: alpha/beta fold hydrolase [Alphaproteobacteria bacterium]|nr:alpha/beta fold hydrolase [Beijerinckiaceae bacterium]NBQ39846.1 alpha/beta fold hydrolase [Alphaproteobacteria bacterium]